jgi:hypothetical protein
LAASAAKEYFFETPILLILLREINKIGVSKNFILSPKAAEYFYPTPRYGKTAILERCCTGVWH